MYPSSRESRINGIKVVPTMTQVAASGLTIRGREVPKIAYTSKGRIAAYKPTTGSNPGSAAHGAYRRIAQSATVRALCPWLAASHPEQGNTHTIYCGGQIHRAKPPLA